MISQIWLQQYCCTIKTKHTNAKYTEGIFHPGMMHRDPFNNSQNCILITHMDSREHNSCSCCQERGCAVVTLPGITQELCKNQVWHHNSRKFRAWLSISKELWMKIVPCITNISGIQTESQRHHLTGMFTLLHWSCTVLLWLRIQLLSALSWFKVQRNGSDVMKPTVLIIGNLQNCG